MSDRSLMQKLWEEPAGPQLLDIRGAARDTFLAGGYASAATGAVLGSWKAAGAGFGFGGFLGIVLHFVPRGFERGSRTSRVLLRALSGAIAGAGSGSTLQTYVKRDPDPREMRRSMITGAAAGALFYALWGLFEPRSRVHPERAAEVPSVQISTDSPT